LEPGDNSKYIDFTLLLSDLPRIDLNEPDKVQARMREFFDVCSQHDMKPTVAGMALALNLDRRRLWEIKTGNYHTSAEITPASTDIIKKAYLFMENLWENYMQNGKINPMAGVFLGVNNYGYYDVKQINLTPTTENPLGQELTCEQIEAAVKELPDYTGD
jgi:hypothetical protein